MNVVNLASGIPHVVGRSSGENLAFYVAHGAGTRRSAVTSQFLEQPMLFAISPLNYFSGTHLTVTVKPFRSHRQTYVSPVRKYVCAFAFPLPSCTLHMLSPSVGLGR